MGGGARRPKYEPDFHWGVWICGEGGAVAAVLSRNSLDPVGDACRGGQKHLSSVTASYSITSAAKCKRLSLLAGCCPEFEAVSPLARKKYVPRDMKRSAGRIYRFRFS
jgi:hypothetical protein